MPIERCRLVKFDEYTETLDQSFDLSEQVLNLVGAEKCASCCHCRMLPLVIMWAELGLITPLSYLWRYVLRGQSSRCTTKVA